MGFEIDDKLMIVATNDNKLRKAFGEYCKDKPDKAIGRYLFKIFYGEKEKITKAIDLLDQMNLFCEIKKY